MKSNLNYFIAMLSLVFLVLYSCKDPEVERKIDAPLKLQIKTLQETDQLDKPLSILFKTTEDLTDMHKSVFENKGIKITANIGRIYTATLPARMLYDLAKMKFVESIQGSREFKIQPFDSLK